MDEAKRDLYWVLLFLLFIGLIWYFTGGPSNPSAISGPFLNNPQDKYTQQVTSGSQQISGSGTSEFEEIEDMLGQEPTAESAYKYEATLNVSRYTAGKTDPSEEYIEIKASSGNDQPLRITGWKLEGKGGLDISIKKGVYLPYSGQVNSEQDIFLRPGEKAIVITGESPLGYSFRLNKCTGYFEQFQDYNPNLPKKCPYLEDEDLPRNLKDDCLDYIEDLPNCKMQLSLPLFMKPECREFINKKLNYASCVETHKNDSDFYQPEWRIYLGREEDLWKEKRETILLRDQNNNIIDWESY